MAATATSSRERARCLSDSARMLGEARTAQMIPGASLELWRDVIIEHRLGAEPRLADVMGALVDPELVRSSGRLPPWLDHPVAREWLREELPSSVLWFEWDAARLQRGRGAPLISVCLSDRVLGADASRRVPRAPHSWRALLDRALAAFDLPGTAERLVDIAQRLPDRGELTHAASLEPRGVRRLRLVAWMVAGAVEPWLRRCAWPGPLAEVRPILAASAAPYLPIGVQLELDADGVLGPYLGLETPEYDRPPSRAQLRPWVQRLAQRGLALDSRELDGICGRLRDQGDQAGARAERLYFKAAWTGAWQAKAYLAAGSMRGSG